MACHERAKASRMVATEKIVAIVGPTASGKSALAIELAEKFNGEVICADSRTVYKYMDIGTAKPSKEDRAEVPHHLLDLVEPNQRFTAADFKLLAEKAIKDIHSRRKLPIIVGGTGLYMSVLLYDFQLRPPADAAFRAQLEKLTTPQLIEKLAESDPEVASKTDTKNRRRMIRAIETAGLPKVRLTALRPATLLIGLRLNKQNLQTRIAERADKMITQGLLDEVRSLGEKYGWEKEAMTGVAYRATKQIVFDTSSGKYDLRRLKEAITKGDLALAKKQMTWFKRDANIKWLDKPEDANRSVSQFLSDE